MFPYSYRTMRWENEKNLIRGETQRQSFHAISTSPKLPRVLTSTSNNALEHGKVRRKQVKRGISVLIYVTKA